MSATYLNSAIQMHAHKCEACEKNGKEVVWVHPDICRGKVAAHKCPECGTVNWKQCKVESAKLPQVAQHVQPAQINLETLLGYILLAVGLALIGYGAFLYVTKGRRVVGVDSHVE